MHMCGGTMRYGCFPVAVSGTTTTANWLSAVDDTLPVTDVVNKESGHTVAYTLPPVLRKRSRDDDAINIHPLLYSPNNIAHCFENLQHNDRFVDEQINCLISDHARMIAMEIEEKRRIHTGHLMASAEERISKKLRGKEEEIQKINILNLALEERVKSMCAENQIWKELAQSNEAMVNALRSNLEQVIAQVHGDDDDQHRYTSVLIDDEAESCCGSNSYVNGGGGGDCGGGGGKMEYTNRRCVSCRKEEASLLFLPCRHLCACDACGHLMDYCPLCNCAKNGSIHVIRW